MQQKEANAINSTAAEETEIQQEANKPKIELTEE